MSGDVDGPPAYTQEQADAELQDAAAAAAAQERQTTEQIVLGAMMGSTDAVWPVLEALLPDDFEQPRHEVLARAIVAQANAGHPTDPTSVDEYLKRHGLVQQAGGPGYVWTLPTYYPASSAGYHAGLIAQAATRRRLSQAGAQIRGLALEPGDADVQLEQAAQALQDVAQRRTGKVRPFADAFDRVVDRVESRAPRYTRTPWPELDGYLSGWQPGRLYVIGARPAAGKSVMALQAAVGLAQHGRVAFTSLEMDQDDLMTRLIAMHAQVNLTALERSTVSTQEWERIAKSRGWVHSLALDVDDRSDVTMQQIVANARATSRRGPLSAVVIDYLGLIRTPQDKRGRWEHVGDISRGCKVLAKRLGVPVILLAQLNRESVAGGKQRDPNLADLRESGSIEQDADVVLLLQRRLDDEQRDTGLLDVIVGKNRQGRVGKFHLRFQGEYARMLSALPARPEDRDTRVRLDVDG